ncbi:MAG: aldo/keto reductase [Catenisphaera adipataccumulans]|jgi:diketogulonate reductase-like aldo/keto reductase|uniref:aldo/keto reductase n=1 Tax=Catenisphaera adipataccumulans TaxID=700500 RepID=UPI003D8F21F6
MEYKTLNDGHKMPMEGFGVYRVTDRTECENAVYQAIRAGYRLLDTAAIYGNEDALGNAVRKAIQNGLVKREELFITSKIFPSDMMSYDTARAALNTSLQKSGLDYFDLYLIHQPYGDYFSAWRAMEDAKKEGKLRSIGVSNFFPNLLVNFCETVDTIPAVNQIETHPWYVRNQDLGTAHHYGVAVEAWGPLGGTRYHADESDILKSIAKKYHKTPSQIVLRWNIERGVMIIPKSVHEERIRQNIDIWDFSLTKEEIQMINTLDTNGIATSSRRNDPDQVRLIFEMGRNMKK